LLDTIFLVIGFVLVIEGIFPLLFTNLWKQTFIKVTQKKNGQIKFYGLLSVLLGMALILFGN